MKKYEFTGEVKRWPGRTLRQIRATAAFGHVKAGDIGGWIEKEENLSHEGHAWVYGNARVYGNAWVYGSAQVYDSAQVYGNARVYGNAQVYGDARVCGNARVRGDAQNFNTRHCLCVGPIGSRADFTTFFRTKDLEIYVVCGCFWGSIEAFAERVKATHGENEHAKRYMAAIALAKACIDLTPEESTDAAS